MCFFGMSLPAQEIVSLDGQYLFFGSYFYYYWLDAKIIEDLKPKELK